MRHYRPHDAQSSSGCPPIGGLLMIHSNRQVASEPRRAHDLSQCGKLDDAWSLLAPRQHKHGDAGRQPDTMASLVQLV